jgi:hypothetical protein
MLTGTKLRVRRVVEWTNANPTTTKHRLGVAIDAIGAAFLNQIPTGKLAKSDDAQNSWQDFECYVDISAMIPIRTDAVFI